MTRDVPPAEDDRRPDSPPGGSTPQITSCWGCWRSRITSLTATPCSAPSTRGWSTVRAGWAGSSRTPAPSRRAATSSWRRWSKSTPGCTETTPRRAWPHSARSARYATTCPGSPTRTFSRPSLSCPPRGRIGTMIRTGLLPGPSWASPRPPVPAFASSALMPRAAWEKFRRPRQRTEPRRGPQGDPGPLRRRPAEPGPVRVRGRDDRRLEHPGIVPVYGLGHYADGRPYYAMRFIKGKASRRRSIGFTRPRNSRARPGRVHSGAARAAGAVHRRLRCDGLCPQPRRAASRPQAGQHHAGQVRRDAGGRLGPGQGRWTNPSPRARSSGRSCL